MIAVGVEVIRRQNKHGAEEESGQGNRHRKQYHGGVVRAPGSNRARQQYWQKSMLGVRPWNNSLENRMDEISVSDYGLPSTTKRTNAFVLEPAGIQGAKREVENAFDKRPQTATIRSWLSNVVLCVTMAFFVYKERVRFFFIIETTLCACLAELEFWVWTMDDGASRFSIIFLD